MITGKLSRDIIPKMTKGTMPYLWLLVALLMVASCTHYEAAPIQPQHTVEQFAARQLSDPSLRDEVSNLMPQAAAQWPPQIWDRGQLRAVAVVRNPDLAVAHAQIKAALAHEVTAAELANPDLTLQSEYA